MGLAFFRHGAAAALALEGFGVGDPSLDIVFGAFRDRRTAIRSATTRNLHPRRDRVARFLLEGPRMAEGR